MQRTTSRSDPAKKTQPKQREGKKKERMKEAKPSTAKLSCLSSMKSQIPCTMVSMAPAIDVYVKFSKETTLHGLKHTVAENLHWFERWLWLVLTGCAFFGAVYCGVTQLARYRSDPVVVSMQRDFRSWRTTFPAVTACFLDRVEPEKARDNILMHWNVTQEADPDKYKYYYSFIELVADVSFRNNLQNFWKYQTDETMHGLDLLKLALSVLPTIPLNVLVSNEDKDVIWVPVMTEMGICQSFNSQYSEFQYLMENVDWSVGELLHCHYRASQCYVRVDSVNSALRLFIHSPYDIPSAISNPTGEVMPGEELVMDFKAVEIQASPEVKKLRAEQRRCKYPDEWLSNNVRAYSFGLCQMHCRSRMAVMFCGCRPYFYIFGASLGGTTALFVGASLLTIAETALFILRYLLLRFLQMQRPRDA